MGTNQRFRGAAADWRAIISGIIGWNEYLKTGSTAEFIDAAAIIAIVILNATLGIIQEKRAEEALAPSRPGRARSARAARWAATHPARA